MCSKTPLSSNIYSKKYYSIFNSPVVHLKSLSLSFAAQQPIRSCSNDLVRIE